MQNKLGFSALSSLFILILFGTLIILAMLLSGCTKSRPSCDDKKTVKAVIAEASETFKKQLSGLTATQPGMELSDDEWRLLRAGMEITVKNINQQGFDGQTGKYACSADLIINQGGAKESILISYTSEHVQNTGNVQVTISGL